MLTHPWWLTSERNEPPRSQHLWPPDVTYRSWGIPEVDVESGPWTGLILKHFPSSTSARMPLWTEGNNKDYSRSTSTTKSSSANAAPFGENSLWKLWPRERRMLPKARIWNPSASQSLSLPTGERWRMKRVRVLAPLSHFQDSSFHSHSPLTCGKKDK